MKQGEVNRLITSTPEIRAASKIFIRKI
jgi:hypothetical protein